MTTYIDLINIWEVAKLGGQRDIDELEDWLRQHPSAERLVYDDQEAQRDYERAREQQEWCVR